MNDVAPHFETSRLRVRPFGLDDLDAFVAYRADPEIARYQSWSDYTSEQGRSLIESMQGLRPGTPGEWYQFALEERTAGTLVGDLALHVSPSEPRQAEIGFTLATDQQGKGYGTEALQALLGHTLRDLGLHRVFAITDARNTAAAALLGRVRMRQEAHFIDNVFFKGAWGSELLFAMLQREWEARR